jgi:hypothetical protein
MQDFWDTMDAYNEMMDKFKDHSIWSPLVKDSSDATKTLGEFKQGLHEASDEVEHLKTTSTSGMPTDVWEKLKDKEKEATQAVKEYKEEVKPVYEAKGSKAGIPSDVWERIKDSAGNAKTSVGDYKKEVDDSLETNKMLLDIINDLKTSVGNLSTTTGQTSDSLKKASDKTNELKTSFDKVNTVEPVFDTSLKKICDGLEGVKTDTTDLAGTNKIEWNTITSDVANSELAFSGTMKEMSQSTDDTTKTLLDDADKISKAFTKEKWTFQGVADGLGETFKRAREAIKGEWNQIADKLNGEHTVGAERIKIDLPKFARGGFPEDGVFLASHHELVGHFSNGKTAVANNAQIVEGIANGVYQATVRANAQNNGNNKYISNTIVVDGEVIARTVTKAQERQNFRYSPT